MWNTWIDLTFHWVFPLVVAFGTGTALLAWWWFASWLFCKALLGTLEVAVIVEAAREAKRQDRAPILRAWTRLDNRWGRDG